MSNSSSNASDIVLSDSHNELHANNPCPSSKKKSQKYQQKFQFTLQNGFESS
uniref:Uncharacterized protein n=1 Tax=Romanomermis culicivorax TaxID=13658 RepID=A0A915J3C1_ROMCU